MKKEMALKDLPLDSPLMTAFDDAKCLHVWNPEREKITGKKTFAKEIQLNASEDFPGSGLYLSNFPTLLIGSFNDLVFLSDQRQIPLDAESNTCVTAEWFHRWKDSLVNSWWDEVLKARQTVSGKWKILSNTLDYLDYGIKIGSGAKTKIFFDGLRGLLSFATGGAATPQFCLSYDYLSVSRGISFGPYAHLERSDSSPFALDAKTRNGRVTIMSDGEPRLGNSLIFSPSSGSADLTPEKSGDLSLGVGSGTGRKAFVFGKDGSLRVPTAVTAGVGDNLMRVGDGTVYGKTSVGMTTGGANKLTLGSDGRLTLPERDLPLTDETRVLRKGDVENDCQKFALFVHNQLPGATEAPTPFRIPKGINTRGKITFTIFYVRRLASEPQMLYFPIYANGSKILGPSRTDSAYGRLFAARYTFKADVFSGFDNLGIKVNLVHGDLTTDNISRSFVVLVTQTNG